MKQTKIIAVIDDCDVNYEFNSKAEKLAYEGYELKKLIHCPVVYSNTSNGHFSPKIIGIFEKDNNELNLCKQIKEMADSYGVSINKLGELTKFYLENDVVSVTRCKDCEYCEELEPVNGCIDCKCAITNRYCLAQTDFCNYGIPRKIKNKK